MDTFDSHIIVKARGRLSQKDSLFMITLHYKVDVPEQNYYPLL